MAPTDSELIDRARRDDPSAFPTLVERYFGFVYAIAYARVRQREAAEDLTQEVFLRAFLPGAHHAQPDNLDAAQQTGRAGPARAGVAR
jgi:DNA-directed RNA polymerase specialized sigma24 family protein